MNQNKNFLLQVDFLRYFVTVIELTNSSLLLLSVFVFHPYILERSQKLILKGIPFFTQ